MTRRALVTGACGFTGTHMVELLLKEGWEVVATDLERSGHKDYYCEAGDLHPAYYEDFIKNLSVELIYADLTQSETLRPLFKYGYDAIFHTASLYDYFAEWDVLCKVNVEGTKNLAELAIEYGVGRFVHWSTDGVYGEAHDGPIDETAPHNPPNLYSKSKAAQEKILWMMHKDHGLPLTVIRPAPIYGPRHIYGFYHILYCIEKIGTGLVISWYPKKYTLMFPSIHVIDLVRAAEFLTKKSEAVGEAYNVLSDCITQTEFLEFCYRALAVKKIVRIPVWWPVFKAFATLALAMSKLLDKKARKMELRPKIDVPMVEYVTHQYWFNNQKLKDTGFKFIYEDPRKGIWEYITWCKERGWL